MPTVPVLIQIDDVERPATPAEKAHIDEVRSGEPPTATTAK